MCTTTTRSPAAPESENAAVPDWIADATNGGSLPHVDVDSESNGWSSPPADLFLLRGPTYLTRRHKTPSEPYLLLPAGVDWLRSSSRLDNLLARPDNRIASALRHRAPLKSFVFAVNLQIPGRDCHSAVFYFASDAPIPHGSLLHRFVNGDDAFRNSRFKIVNRIVKGPWIVKAAVGNHAACLLGKALTCRYYRGENYLEVDVDIGSSAIANAVLHLAMGYAAAVTIDMGFVVEGQSEEELPERLIGAVRIAQMEIGAATFVETRQGINNNYKGKLAGSARVNANEGEED